MKAISDQAGTTGENASEHAEETRALLLDAAERLFVERGIDAVSLREIVRAAGQRNASALHYHFGSRDGVLEALIDLRMPAVNVRRLALIAPVMAGRRKPSPRRLAEALILPLAEIVEPGNEHGNWVRLAAQIYANDSIGFAAIFRRKNYDEGLRQVGLALRRAHPGAPPLLLDQRNMLAVRQAVHALADWQRGVLTRQSGVAIISLPLFVANLLDVTEAMLAAKFSAEALRLVPKDDPEMP